MTEKMTAEEALERFRQDLLPDPHDERDVDTNWIRRRWEKCEPAIRSELESLRTENAALRFLLRSDERQRQIEELIAALEVDNGSDD